MQIKILIVEDEILVALPLKMTLTRMGFDVVGIAPDTDAACVFARHQPDIAFVDINLRDGPTGPDIGAMLARDYGASVLFVTANPRQLECVEPGPIGVISKPLNDNDIVPVLDFLVSCRQGAATPPPPSLVLFGDVSVARAQA